MQLKALNSPTPICKICFKKNNTLSFDYIFNNHLCICEECWNNFKPKFIHFKHNGYCALALYQYDENIRSLLYKYKGCFDYELKEVFLNKYLSYLKFKYYGYTIVPIPSYEEDDKKRGFNHILEVCRLFNLPILNVIIKTKRHKQADQSFRGRKSISKYLKVVNGDQITGKKILIVDDVYTTGSSVDACIKLISEFRPKTIQIFVLSKNILKVKV